jgi:predicted XRE-type DNA-binding protein
MAVMLPLPMSSKLGPALRTWRALRRIKQSHAAELFGVSQATIALGGGQAGAVAT